MTIRNLMDEGIGPLRLIWHADRMHIDVVEKKHVWLLTTVVDMPNGEMKIIHRTRAPSRTPTSEELAQRIAKLKEMEVEQVWVTRKFPLLVFLWPALIPFILVGGPMAYIMPIFGL